MSVGEGTAPAILARQTHRKATGHQGGKRHVLAHAPVHRQVAAAHGGAVVIDLFHQRMRGNGGGNGGDAFSQALPLCHGNGSVGHIGPFFAQERRPVDGELGFEITQHRVGSVLTGIQSGAVGFDHLVTQALTQALRSQALCVHLARAGVGRDFFVHQWLRQTGRVLLVVTEFAKTSDVNHHVLPKLHAVFQRQLGGQNHRLGVVSIDVKHRRFNHLHNVGAKHRGPHIAWVGSGETNLVVDDDVHRAAGGVATGLRQRQSFLVDALSTKSCVAVHQHGQHLAACGVATAVHARAHRTLDHRVDDLQVRGVEGQAQVNRTAWCGHVRAKALVVFHVAGRQLFGGCVVELGKQIGRQFAHGVDQHIQAAAVGHANHHLLNAFDTRHENQLVHGGDKAFSAL